MSEEVLTKDSKIVSMGRDCNGNIIIDICTSVVLDEKIARNLRLDGVCNGSNIKCDNTEVSKADKQIGSVIENELCEEKMLSSKAGKSHSAELEGIQGGKLAENEYLEKSNEENIVYPVSVGSRGGANLNENRSRARQFVMEYPLLAFWFAVSIFIANIILIMVCFREDSLSMFVLPEFSMPDLCSLEKFSMPDLCSLPIIGVICCIASCFGNLKMEWTGVQIM